MIEPVINLIAVDLDRTERLITANVDTEQPLLATAASHVLFAGGKRLRPALVLLAARGLGAVPAGAHELAAAMELIHAASLVHDDVVDGSSTRRGVPTVNARWNDRVSVLTGDYLLAAAFELISRRGNRRIIEALARVMRGMAAAEIEQLNDRFNLEVSEEQYLSRIERKTAALIAACCEIGGILCRAGTRYVAAVTEYGRLLGTAFQIVDDLLDVEGDPQLSGKAVGADLAEGVITLPVVRALAGDQAPKLRRALAGGPPANGELEQAIQAIRHSDAIPYCRELAARYCDQARESVNSVPDRATRGALVALCDFALTRSH